MHSGESVCNQQVQKQLEKRFPKSHSGAPDEFSDLFMQRKERAGGLTKNQVSCQITLKPLGIKKVLDKGFTCTAHQPVPPLDLREWLLVIEAKALIERRIERKIKSS